MVDWNNFFVPHADRVLAVIDKPTSQTPGGLYLPETSQELPNIGHIVATGGNYIDKKGRTHHQEVQIGDKILFSHHGGQRLELQGKEVVILREDEIIGIMQI